MRHYSKLPGPSVYGLGNLSKSDMIALVRALKQSYKGFVVFSGYQESAKEMVEDITHLYPELEELA